MQSLQAFANDSRAQVADVQGLGHVGTAVVHHHGLAGAGFLYAEVRGGPHLFQIARQEAAGEPQVDEAGHAASAREKS